MPESISKTTFKFLKDLSQNNNREWFNENKDIYLKAQENVLLFLEDLIDEIAEFDEEVLKISPKKALFRIYRDVRFSLNKLPYKTHFGAGLGFRKTGKISGYYLHIEPLNSFVAGGVFRPEKDDLKKIRTQISQNSEEFLKIINDKTFESYFPDFSQNDKLKRVPNGFEKEDPMADYLKLKNFVVRHSIEDSKFMQTSATKNIAEICLVLKPLNDFIENALIK